VLGTLFVLVAMLLAALSLADLVSATTGGATLVVAPVLGIVLGWLASRRGTTRWAWRLAVGVNAIILAVTVVAIFLLGGT